MRREKALKAKNNPFYLLLLASERCLWHQLIQINRSLQMIIAFLELVIKFHSPLLPENRLQAAFNVKLNKFSSFSVAMFMNE